MTVFCQHCKTTSPEGSRYCINCDEILPIPQPVNPIGRPTKGIPTLLFGFLIFIIGIYFTHILACLAIAYIFDLFSNYRGKTILIAILIIASILTILIATFVFILVARNPKQKLNSWVLWLTGYISIGFLWNGSYLVNAGLYGLKVKNGRNIVWCVTILTTIVVLIASFVLSQH